MTRPIHTALRRRLIGFICLLVVDLLLMLLIVVEVLAQGGAHVKRCMCVMRFVAFVILGLCVWPSDHSAVDEGSHSEVSSAPSNYHNSGCQHRRQPNDIYVRLNVTFTRMINCGWNRRLIEMLVDTPCIHGTASSGAVVRGVCQGTTAMSEPNGDMMKQMSAFRGSATAVG